MAERRDAPDVQALEDSYEIVGELRGSDNARRYIATRRDDQADAVITIYSTSDGGVGENNELSHLAADAQLLSTIAHPALAQLIEARWVRDGVLAVVTTRLHGTTLAEALSTEGAFTNPRAASVLQEVAGVLDWARTSGIVHRGVTPEDVYFDPETDRVRVAFRPMAIPPAGTSDATSDHRTIGALAWSMLTGSPFSEEDSAKSLGDLVPNQSLRVVDATEAMVYGAQNPADEPDVATFVGIVAAGDVLKQAEVEIAAMKEEYEEQHRIALASCENQRGEIERRAAEQAEMLASERADFEREMSDHQDQLAAIHDELKQRTESLEQRITEFESRRAEVAQLRNQLQDQIAEAQHARETAAAARRAANGGRDPLPESTEPDDIRKIIGVQRKPLLAKREPRPGPRRRWVVPSAAAGAVLVVAAAVGGIVYYRHEIGGSRGVVIQRPAPPRSAGGSVAPVAPAPTVQPDSNTSPVAPPQPAPPVRRTPRPTNDTERPTPATPAPAVEPSRDTSVQNDSMRVRGDSVIRPDVTVRRDSAGGYDSVVVKRGTPFRVDSMRLRDTLRARPDSGGPPF